ncbi:Uncharacterised protein [Vibrio cholerae]|nr:Uncharacterised protein [Vibrio cholerae]
MDAFSRRDVPNEWLPCRPLCFSKIKLTPKTTLQKIHKISLGSRAKIKPRDFTLIPRLCKGFSYFFASLKRYKLP